MKISTFLGFCFLAFLNLQSTHGYVASPQQYGRTFDLFNLFPFVDNSYATLSSRISALESSVASTNTQVASLLNLVQSMSFGIQSLQSQLIAANAPKCSAALTAIGGKIFGNYCYTLGTTAKTFGDAQLACAANGAGILAEPTPTTVANGLAVYNALKTPAVAAAASPNLWIGVVKPAAATTFSFASSLTPLAAADQTAIFGTKGDGTVASITTAADTGKPEAATLDPNGKYVNELQTPTTRLYICQNAAV